jgi:hypothetical protein
MEVEEFAEFMKGTLDAFAENMRRLEIERTWRSDWMELFLDWSEWETEAHETYWDWRF